jgi:hypothetical protein
MKPTFEPTDDGLEIIDRIERHRYRLTTHDPVSIDPADTDEIQYPVDSAVRITTDTLTLPTTHYVYVRDETGAMVAEVKPDEQTFLPEGEYTLDLSGPLKVYAQVDSSVQVYSDPEQTHITLDGVSSVILGARSYHTRPARTITTTAEPTNVMEAVSTFGSALKTTSPERSYPTLRGHPPAIKLGNKLHIPEGATVPDTNIQIEVPPTLGHIFVVTPLSYYLGAKIVPNAKPRLTTDGGYAHSLTGPRRFETTVGQILQQIFFLDTIVRTEGMTPLPLQKREAVEPLFDSSIKELYNLPIAEQIQSYLNIPSSKLDSIIPEWQFETQVDSKPKTTEFLPFVANDLATVRISETEKEPPSVSDEAQTIMDFTRGSHMRNTNPVRNTGSESTWNDTSTPQLIKQSWNISKRQNIVSSTPLSAFQNSIGRTPHDDPIDIEVVCNDDNMSEESEHVDDIYGDRNEVPFGVSFHYNTSTSELKDILARKSDFLHYIGHIDRDGFQCTDGKLDVSEVDETNIKAFFLNACQSHAQGLHLIQAGSIGGIVTLGNVVNSGAVKVGNATAKLLNEGFPLYGALDIVQNETLVGQQYYMVGDGKTTIAQSELEVPNVCTVEKQNGEFSVRMKTYSSVQAGKGTICTPYLDPVDGYYVVPGATECLSIDQSQLKKFLNQGRFPVIAGQNVYWSDDVAIDSLW